MAQLTADVSDEPSWIHGFSLPRFFRDPQCNRELVAQLRQVLSQHALALIDRIARVYTEDEAAAFKSNLERKTKNNPIELAEIPIEIDLRPNEKMVRGYENDIWKDASVATVREFFINWTATKHGSSISGDIRYAACILLDSETLAQLAPAPDDFRPTGNTGYESIYWVKMVEAKSEPEYAFRTRVFGKNDLVDYWFTQNYNRTKAGNRSIIYKSREFGRPLSRTATSTQLIA
ncbi:hypothetical protein QQZ08_001783 [Neonectria magnoliae]|uniref:Uncharacterized protein n=1 Tax=Neonectria magnoliae TaxID=2732573 RepID=A0ABR1ID89_9HYPO